MSLQQDQLDQLFNTIKRNQQNKLTGKVNSIYWSMPRLTEELNFPGFIPGKYYGVTANTHIGKTIFTKWLVLLSTYERWLEYGGSFHWEVIWFALEESESDFWNSIIALCIYLKYGHKYLLNSSIISGFSKKTMTEEELKVVFEARNHPFFIECTQRVTVIDSILNPTGLKYEVDKIFLRKSIGTWNSEDENGKKGIFNYKLNSDTYIHVVTDNLNILQEEKNFHTGSIMTKSQTMEFYSTAYCLNVFCKRYNAIVTDVQQQSAESEAKLYTHKGEVVESKLEPTLSDLGDSKKTSRNWDVGLGLFNPVRHDIKKINGFNIDIPKLGGGDKYRKLIILKDRIAGYAGSRLNMYCEGYIPYFKEMLPMKYYIENPDLINRL